MQQVTRFVFSVAVFLVCTSATQSYGLPQEDRWLNGAGGYAQAVELQRQLQVPLVIYFYADWCPYCHALERKYFPAAPVQEYLRKVVKVRINPEHGRAEQEIASRYGVSGYPRFLIKQYATSQPVAIHPFLRGGNLSPAQFAQACNDVGPRSSNIGQMSNSGSQLNTGPTARIIGTPSPRSAIVTVKPTTVVAPEFLPGDLPTVDQVLARYVAAVGGSEAHLRLTSRVATGRVDVPGVGHGGKLESYASAPNKSLTIMKIGSLGILKQGFDGKAGWDQSDQTGVRTSAGAGLDSLARDSEFHRDLKLKQLYAKTKLVGKVKHGFREVYLVEATPRAGSPELFYFDVESGLLIRRDITRQTSQGLVRAEVYLSDWREVDGVKIPFKMTHATPNLTFVFTIEEVKHNVPVDEGIFRKPAR